MRQAYQRYLLADFKADASTVEARLARLVIWLLFRVRVLELSQPPNLRAAEELAHELDKVVGGKLLQGEVLTLAEMRDLIEVLL
jgi:hypothetical protein